jgi:hypothetical protein
MVLVLRVMLATQCNEDTCRKKFSSENRRRDQ